MTLFAPPDVSGRASRTVGVRRGRTIELAVVWVLGAGFAVVAATRGLEPVGIVVVDQVMVGVGTFGVAIAASRGRRWSWLVSSGLSTAIADGIPWTAVAGFALGLSLLATVADWRFRLIGVMVGGATVLTVIHQPTGRSVLLPLLASSTMVLLLVVSGVRNLREPLRRRILGVGFAIGCYVGFSLLLFGVSMFDARTSIEQGLDRSREGFEAARRGDTDVAEERLHRASQAFSSAADSSSSILSLPARLIPGVGQQLRAVDTMAEEASAIARTASDVVAAGGSDVLVFDNGSADLAVLASVSEPIDELVATLGRAEGALGVVDSPWLLGPVADRLDEFRIRIDEARDGVSLVADAVDVLPSLLGRERPARYFTAFVTPVEARGRTGFMANFGILEIADGSISMSEVSRTNVVERSLADRAPPLITGPDDYVSRYQRFQPNLTWRNIQMSPDFPSVAQVIEQVYRQSGGEAVDGVISLDPWALAAILRFTGPVQIPGLDERLTHENATSFLLQDQYLSFEEDLDGRIDMLEQVAASTFAQVHGLTIGGPRALVDHLGPVVEGGHLVAYSSDPDVQRFFERIGVDGGLPPVQGDFLSVVSSNAGGNKIDLFLERSIDYHAAFDPATSTVDATVEVTMDNTAPASGLPGYIIGNNVKKVSATGEPLPSGYNRAFVSIYSPLQLLEARIDGEVASVQVETERGRWVYSTFVDIPPGDALTIELDLTGTIDAGGGYRLDVAAQPMVVPDDLRVSVTPAGARRDLVSEQLVADGPSWEAHVALDRTHTFALDRE